MDNQPDILVRVERASARNTGYLADVWVCQPLNVPAPPTAGPPGPISIGPGDV